MAEKRVNLKDFLKNWFYDKDEIDDIIGDIQEYVNR